MLDKLDSELLFQQDALRLLTRRQDILASNIANADTPGYEARDINFSKQLKEAVDKNVKRPDGISLTLTSAKHISASRPSVDSSQLLYRIPDQPSADGNTVDMDRERVNYADNTVKYQTSLAILSSQLKNMMSVISQG